MAVEKPRWQMTPAYGQAIVVLAFSGVGAAGAAFHNVVFLFLWTLLFVTAVPPNHHHGCAKIAHATGPYAVGYTHLPSGGYQSHRVI
ncbi:MAG: hypothetical protein M5U34_30115 [Chloroflexi bacterium]|nr:hypothetical protein [Chloroflexota bacterium]